MEIVIFGRFRAKEGCEAEVEAALCEVQAPTRAEPGCLELHLYRSREGSASLLRAFAVARHGLVRTPRGAAPHPPHARMRGISTRPSTGCYALGPGVVTGESTLEVITRRRNRSTGRRDGVITSDNSRFSVPWAF